MIVDRVAHSRRAGPIRVAVVLAVCALTSASAGAALSEGTSQARDIVVTRDGADLPAGCTPKRVAALMDGFFQAFDDGDWAAVDAFFAPAGPGPQDFKLFSWAQDVVYDRNGVLPYLIALQARGERFRLIELNAVRSGASQSVAGSFLVDRPAGLGVGKVLLDCGSQRIWQMAANPSTHTGPIVLSCPRPAGWTPTGPIVACTGGRTAPALAPGFRLGTTRSRMPRLCTPRNVERRVRDTLADFDIGNGAGFGQQFVSRGSFHPYTASIPGSGFAGRRRMSVFVRARYIAGDGWTARALDPPRGKDGLPSTAVYGLTLALTYQTTSIAARASAKLVIDCGSGLLRAWIGPTLKMPA